MEQTRERVFSLDGDVVRITFRYNAEDDVWHGDYPDFIGSPRYTPGGRPWVDVSKDDCPHATGEYGDCGGCKHLRKQRTDDLLGICMNDILRANIK